MTRRIGDDELAFRGAEVAIGNVDRDSLFPLGLQPVGQKRRVEITSGGADDFRVGFQTLHVVFVDHLAVVKQPSDQRAFAVINAAASDETQQLLLLVLLQVCVNVGRN